MNLNTTSLLKDLIERIDYSVFILDNKFNCIEANTHATKLVANKIKEVKQTNFESYLDKIDALNFKKAISDAKKLNEEVSIHAKVGKFEKCCSIRCKFEQNLFFVYIKEVEADICMQLQNQSKKVENASSLALENLSNIINSNSSPTLVINNQNKVKLANQAFKKIFNYSHNSIGNQNISKIFSKEFKFDSSKVDYWNARKDLTIKNGNNRQIPIDLKINQLSYNGENYFVFVIRDIRKIKAFQRKIMHQNKKLQDIAWMHSHIMRQPVTNILAIINAVEASEKLEDKLECINLLKECSNQFDSLVKKVFEKTGSKSIVN